MRIAIDPRVARGPMARCRRRLVIEAPIQTDNAAMTDAKQNTCQLRKKGKEDSSFSEEKEAKRLL